MNTRRIGVIIGAWLALLPTGAGSAQENYPNRPVRIVIPYSPGSVADVFGASSPEHAAQWNASIIADPNPAPMARSPRGSRALGARRLTWLLVTTFFTASPALDAKLRWDRCAISPRSARCAGHRISSSCPRRCGDERGEYVALAKAKPGTLNYSHPGKGSTAISVRAVQAAGRIDVTAVGYRGYRRWCGYRERSDHLHLPVGQPGAGTGADGASGSSARSTMAARNISRMRRPWRAGLSEAQVTPWFGVVVPAATPQPIVERISKALEAALATADVQQKLDIAGCEPKSAPQSSSPTSSRPTWRCGRRSSRKPASRRIEPGTVERSPEVTLRSPSGRRQPACAGVFMTLRACSPWVNSGVYKRIVWSRSLYSCLLPPWSKGYDRSLSIGQLTFGGFLLVLAVDHDHQHRQRHRHPHIDSTFANCSGCRASATWPKTSIAG